jgi:peroxiredoxin
MDGPVLLPRADAPGGRFYPPNLGEPGAPRLESLSYADRHSDFEAVGAHRARSQHTQPQLAAFAEYVDLPFALLSDTDSR